MIDDYTPHLYLVAVTQDECPWCERHGEGVVFGECRSRSAFFCRGCMLNFIDNRLYKGRRWLERMWAEESVIAWLAQIEGYEVIARRFKIVRDDNDETEDLPGGDYERVDNPRHRERRMP